MKVFILMSHDQDRGDEIKGVFKKRSAAFALWKKRAGKNYDWQRGYQVVHSVKAMTVR